MKKFVMGLIVGLLLAVGGSIAYAEVSSLIGKKVDGQLPLIVNGEVSEVPAITIGGVSYIPLRAAGSLFGYKVAWIDGEVIMDQLQEGRASVPTAEEIAERARIEEEAAARALEEKSSQISAKNNALADLNYQIGLSKIKIRNLKMEIDSREENMHSLPENISPGVPYEGSDLQKKHIADLAQLKAELAELEDELVELEARKAAIDTQVE